ncbi:IclR family transcriptional regulator domain-containing protein [Streptosporangium sp. KLBMP 9127]|nr:helix-turn-helix domain-containing protein [Streptosporangium sp. KLBMP 9127]
MIAISESTTPGRSPAVRKAARILFELAAHHEAANFAELSRRLAMPKSSLADICGVLLETGVLARDIDGRMQLGARLNEIARGLVGGTPLLELFHAETPHAKGLAGRTVVLAVLSGLDAAYLSVRPGERPLPLTLKPGIRLPAWSTGTGRALLSTLPDPVIREMHTDAAPLSPSGQLFEMERLIEAVGLARARGFASNADLGEMALAGTAAVVYGRGGPLAAVGSIVDIASADADGDGDAEAVRALARHLSESL